MKVTALWYLLPVPAFALAGLVPEFTIAWVLLLVTSPLLVPLLWVTRDALR